MANDLTTTDPSRRTPWCGLSSDPKLERLVATAPAFSHVCSPDERAALAALIPAYEQALAPASERGCKRAIGKVALAFPASKVSDDEAEARLELYAEALADVPADVLAEACMAVVREARFFPTPAEIRAKCGSLAKRQWELSKIRGLIATHDRMYRPEGEPMTAEDRAEFARIARRAA
jgi:hypothetical protein